MLSALELAVFPIAEKDEIFDIIDYLEKYLIVQINL